VTLAQSPNSAFAFTFNHAAATAMPLSLDNGRGTGSLVNSTAARCSGKTDIIYSPDCPEQAFFDARPSTAACRRQPQSAGGQI